MVKVRALAPEIADFAKTEINEVPERIEKDLEYLREWLKKQPHLNVRMDDQWLIAFLRGCKYSLERAKEKLDTFYTSRALIPEFFRNRDISKGQLKDIIHKFTILPIEDKFKPTHPIIIYYRHYYDANKIDLATTVKFIFLTAEIFINEYDSLTVNGIIAIVDLDALALSHITQATPPLIKKYIISIEKAYPVRVKAIHFINCPPYFERIVNMMKYFSTPKLASRLHVHREVETLFNYVPQRLMPSDLGGEGPSRNQAEYILEKKLEQYKDWIKEDETYGTIEKLRIGKPHTAETLLGLEGSFRSLSVD